MLRPFDQTEKKRRVIVNSVGKARGPALQEIRKEFNINRRISASRVGWIAAFKDYPFILSYQIRSSSVEFCDIEEGISSDGMHNIEMGGEVAWRYNSRAWNALPEVEARKLIDAPNDWEPDSITVTTDAQKMFDATTRARFSRALLFLLAEDNFGEALIRLLGDAAELTPSQAIISTRVGDRLGFDKRPMDWIERLVSQLMNRISVEDLRTQSDRQIGEILHSAFSSNTS